MSDDDQTAVTQSAGSASARRRWPLIAVPAGIMLLVLATVGAWAHHQGYIVITSVACTDEGYRGPVPSFQYLVTEDGLNAYCARRARDEAWW